MFHFHKAFQSIVLRQVILVIQVNTKQIIFLFSQCISNIVDYHPGTNENKDYRSDSSENIGFFHKELTRIFDFDQYQSSYKHVHEKV